MTKYLHNIYKSYCVYCIAHYVSIALYNSYILRLHLIVSSFILLIIFRINIYIEK